jgi:hypothetical protein
MREDLEKHLVGLASKNKRSACHMGLTSMSVAYIVDITPQKACHNVNFTDH